MKILFFTKKMLLSAYKKGIDAEYQYIPLGVVGFISFIGYYFVWHDIASQEYSNIYLRFIGGALCLFLALKQFWPKSISGFLPIYWYITLVYCFPFFFSFMLFHNAQSHVWLMTNLTGVFFLMLLVNWIELLVIITFGIGFAWVVYLFTADVIQIPVAMFETLPTYLTVLVAGSVFIYRKDYVYKEKLDTMRMLGASVAHELRTPLRAITSGVSAIKNVIDKLMSSYVMAKEAKLDVPSISKKQYNNLMPVLDNINSEADSAFMVIDMLLVRVGRLNADLGQMEPCSIVECVDSALERYPFNLGEKDFVHWHHDVDFKFRCNRTLMVHVIFNLIKNALYFVKASGDGEITLWLEVSDKCHRLHFKDTGAGISKRDLPHVFERFFTTTKHGTGTGLAFCKMVMKGVGGDIVCESAHGQYAEFVLTFPVYT